MGNPESTVSDKLKAISGTIATISSVLSAVVGLNDQAAQSIKSFVNLPPIAWGVIAVILLFISIALLRQRFAQRSRLLLPSEELLSLKSNKVEHLKGREEDIDTLLTLCRSDRLVHLVGESGVGKSAVIQSGLYPRLGKDDLGLLPIYVQNWGRDWEAGPRAELYDALLKTLSEEEQKSLNLNEHQLTADFVTILTTYRTIRRRIPLLIFDQFDDYQTLHRDRFRARRRKTWLPVDQVITANTFWRDLKTLLDRNEIHCLFVTRADTASGLESVRFVQPQVFTLDRLKNSIVEPLLNELTKSVDGKPPVISSPDRGWDQLKQRLARDLSQDGAVLPIQMKVVFQGLDQLEALTVGVYQRAGGLQGLEAGHIERHINATARATGVDRSKVRALLLALLNRENGETLKTVPETVEGLALDSNISLPTSLVRKCLEELERRAIVRRRIDSDTSQYVWLLDHDYLCRGVVEAERRANRWSIFVEEKQRAYEEAGSNLWRKWLALLSPWEQVVLGTKRLVGNFRYGALRSFAGWSLLRFVPYVLVITFTYIIWDQNSVWQQAHDLFSEINSNSEYLEPKELDTLWTLAQSRDAIRLSFLKQALENPGAARRFHPHLENIIHAIVGLNPERRKKVTEISTACLQSADKNSAVKLECTNVGVALVTKQK